MVITSQVNYPSGRYHVYDLSDIGRYVCWDECGFEIDVADTSDQADAIVSMYWWHQLNGCDTRPGQLPVFTSHEQLQFIKTYKKSCVPSQVVEFKDSHNNATTNSLYQLRDDNEWHQLTDQEVIDYTTAEDGPVQRWIQQMKQDELSPAIEDVC